MTKLYKFKLKMVLNVDSMTITDGTLIVLINLNICVENFGGRWQHNSTGAGDIRKVAR